MGIWVAITFNCTAIALMALWPRPSHVDDMREMFSISTGPISRVRHRFRRWRRALPPAARVTTLVIQRAFGPVILATIVSAIALLLTAYCYLDAPQTIFSRAISIASNTLERLSQGALSIPNAEVLTANDLPTKALLASFTFVITIGLVRILQQWLFSVARTVICVVFREGSYEVLSGDARKRQRLAALLGVQQNLAAPSKQSS